MARKKKGRKPLLTPETVMALETVFVGGSTVEDACDYAGVSVRSYYYWMEEGETVFKLIDDNPDKELTADQKVVLDFYVRVRRAKAVMRVQAVALITKAAEKNWQAAAFLLERSDPRHWGKRVVDNEHSGTITVRVIRE